MIGLIYLIAMTRPAPSEIGNPPQRSDGRDYQLVSLNNQQDEIQLSGWYIPSENRAAIILLHGYGSNRLEMVSRAEVLADYGYGVLQYDLRGHGESGGVVRAFGWPDLTDVQTALSFLSAREDLDPNRIGILGFSIGGQIAIRAAAEYDQIKAVIADDPGFVTVDDAPPASNSNERITNSLSWLYGRSVSLWTGIPVPPGVPEKIFEIAPRPILFIDTGPGEGRGLVRHFYELAGEPKEIWEIPEAFHGGQFEARPQEYEERMIRFFNQALLEK
jgi:pimeloyl-ACP methyl ester carboxylesterase